VSVRGYDDLQAWLVRRRLAGDGEAEAMPALEQLLDEIADDVLDRPADDETPVDEDPPAG
jgi:adenylate cyclase